VTKGKGPKGGLRTRQIQRESRDEKSGNFLIGRSHRRNRSDSGHIKKEITSENLYRTRRKGGQ